MLGVESQLDWGAVIAAVVPGVLSAVSAVIALLVHRQIRTPSGKPLGQVAEYAHDTAIANNLLLSKANGATETADPAALHAESETPPQVPTGPTPPHP